MSEAEREHWDHRYLTEGARSTDPAAFLVEVAPHFPAGSRILDVGGGSGRNAVWLAKQGHEVTIADVSAAGLDIAIAAADAAGVPLHVIQMDFDDAPVPPGPWDVIIDFHFIKRSLFPEFPRVLRPDGLLVFCRATTQNLERNDRPPRPFLLDPGEGWDLLADFDLVIAREGWSIEERHEFEALARVRPA